MQIWSDSWNLAYNIFYWKFFYHVLELCEYENVNEFLVCYRSNQKKICNPQNRHQTCSVKKVFLEISQSSQKNTCAKVSFSIKLQALGNLIKKETLAQVLSCELCEISKNISLTEHVWTKEHCASSRSETVYWYIVLFGSSLSYALQKCTALRMFTKNW